MKTSRLGFGTSRLHYVRSPERQAILDTAAELGIIHFDTAPSYGDGLAERALGDFVKRQRDRFVVATKYGITPNPLIDAWPRLGTPVRATRALARMAGVLGTGPRSLFTGAAMRTSIEKSLQRLGIDRIDILLLHEPDPDCVTRPDEVLTELDRLRQAGTLGTYGLAGGWQGLVSLLRRTPELGLVIQTAEQEWRGDDPPDITYGALTASRQSFLARPVAEATAISRLNASLARRREGVVLVSTTKSDHLRRLVAAASF